MLANYEDRELARLKAPPENGVDEYQELGPIKTLQFPRKGLSSCIYYLQVFTESIARPPAIV